ncbi:MAG: methyltransferase domain-containing protein [Chitinophagales bacterium]
MDKCCVTPTDKVLDKEFWDIQWRKNETGWDMGQVSPPLKEYIDQLNNKNLKILIPGCGNTYEAEYLLANGFTNVTVIDISPALADMLKEKFSAELGKRIHVICGDFFELTDHFDLILEQTFFCALNPSLRIRYVSKMYELLNTGGRLVGLLFNRIFDFEGPPFGGTQQEYEMLFSPYFKLHTFEQARNSFHKRAATELFINFIKA